jgi:hypothetical protein
MGAGISIQDSPVSSQIAGGPVSSRSLPAVGKVAGAGLENPPAGLVLRGPLITEENSYRWTLALAVLLALAVILPFFRFGQASGHDFEFHLESWMDVAQQWRQGIIFPRWAAWANYGYGEPRFIFYPPASWILGAAFGSLLPWWTVPSVFILMCLVLSSLSMHRLAGDWTPPGAAVAAALFYAANPYQLLVIYLRSDFAEMLASAILPLAVFYALRCSAASQKANARAIPAPELKDAMCLALVYALIWLSNAPAAVISSYALALLVIVSAISRRSIKPLLWGFAGLGTGLMMAAFYIVPAAYERNWVNISQVLSDGLRPEQNFLFTMILDPEHNLFNIEASAVALIVIGLATAGASFAYLRFPARRRLWAPIFALTAVAIWLMTSLSAFVWRYAPELRFVQFSWRWLTPLALCASFFLGQIMTRSRKPALPCFAVSMVLAATAMGLLAGPILPPWWDSEGLGVIQAQVRTERGYEGTDEYVTRGGDRTDLPLSAPPVELTPAPGHVSIQEWEPQGKEFEVEAPVAERVAVRLLNYRAWEVRVNGRPALAESAAGTDQMIVRLPAGKNLVEIHFAETPDRLVGDALSALAVLLLAGTAAVLTRRPKTIAG